MTARIIVFGATGYTGRLVTRELVASGRRPVVAGRSADKLTALAEEHDGLETAAADVGDPESVQRLVERGDVLVSTVGPFTLYGHVALKAAVAAGAHYLDSTGEPAFIRAVFEETGPRAERSWSTVLTAFGVDWVPGNVAGALALRRVAGGRRVDIGYFPMPPAGGAKRAGPLVSSGTRASMLAASASPHHAFRHGRLVPEPGGRRLGRFTVGGKRLTGISVGASEHLALPRLDRDLEEVGVYLGWFGPAARLAQGASLGVAAVGRTGPGRAVLDRAVRRAARTTGEGPKLDGAGNAGTRVVAISRAHDGGVLATVRFEGPVDGYSLTGKLLAWGATRLADDAQSGPGALGPVEAFGLDECMKALADFGLPEVDALIRGEGEAFVRGVTPDDVFDFVLDPAQYTKADTKMVWVTKLADTPDGMIAREDGRFLGRFPGSVITRYRWEKPTSIDVVLEHGVPERLHAWFEIEAAPGGAKVRHVEELHMGHGLLGWVHDRVAGRWFARSVPAEVAEIARLLEAGERGRGPCA